MLIEVPFTGPVDERECFDFDNKERCWLIHIPETATYGFCEDNSCPLLMDIHGLGVTVGDQSNLSDYSRITDQDNVIIVHPEGVNNGWNFGWCCTEEDDVGMIGAQSAGFNFIFFSFASLAISLGVFGVGSQHK